MEESGPKNKKWKVDAKQCPKIKRKDFIKVCHWCNLTMISNTPPTWFPTKLYINIDSLTMTLISMTRSENRASTLGAFFISVSCIYNTEMWDEGEGAGGE